MLAFTTRIVIMNGANHPNNETRVCDLMVDM